MRGILLLVYLCAALAVPGAAAQDSSAPVVLQPGDAVRIDVWRQPDLSGEFPVTDGGTIGHPLYRGVVVAGLPLAEAEARVREYLARLQADPQFVVQPLLRVSVGGEVRQPSLYRLSPATSIADAIALAGGPTERGQLNRVRLFRGGRALEIDLTRPEAGMAQAPIRSGDQIFVDRRVSILRDYIVPAGSVTGALLSLISLLTR